MDAIAAGDSSSISTHAPLAGRDLTGGVLLFLLVIISTHAPLAGRDLRALWDGGDK